jgi:hypothetical protein
MAVSLKIPLLGIPTLDYLAASQPLFDMPWRLFCLRARTPGSWLVREHQQPLDQPGICHHHDRRRTFRSDQPTT